MVPPGASPSHGDFAGDLERIAGLDPWIARLIEQSGLDRLSVLAGLSAPALAALLAGRAAAALTPERIERDDWLGQARRLSAELGPDDTPPPDRTPDDGTPHEPPSGDRRQQAGFSLFFDLVRDDGGHESWNTRVYHEESGAEIVLPGIEPGAWSDWILGRALPAEKRRQAQPFAPPSDATDPLHLLLVRIVNAQVIGGRSRTPVQPLSIEVRLEVTGLDELERALGRATLSSMVRSS
jgi:hypothetical protein